jgi:thiol:disulfide interchange protein
MKKQFLFFTLLFFLCGTGLNAQIMEPVKWKFHTKKIDKQTIELKATATIEEAWKLYGQYSEPAGGIPLSFEFEASDAYELIGKVQESPEPKKEYDDIMMANIQTFKKEATFTQKIKILSDKDFTINANISGQSCKEACVLFDEDHTYRIKGLQKEQKTTEPESKPRESESSEEIQTDETDSLANDEIIEKETDLVEEVISDAEETIVSDADKKGSYWGLFWLSFVAGLAAIVTPCVFPMIPLTVSFFLHGKGSRRKSMFEAGVFGLSIILIYTIIGTLVAVTLGPASANWLSTSWINVVFFLIFVFFAASFFGMFEIVLPNWMVAKSEAQVEKGGFLAPFFMALSLVIVSFSCTGPLLGAVLVQTAGGEFMRPITGMLGFSIAFALPFMIFAFFPQLMKDMPKSGGWLNSVKVVLGFLELALGLKFLSIADLTYHWGLLDRDVYLALWIAIFTLMGLYLIGKIKFANDSDIKYIKVPRLMMAIVTFAFVIYMIPGLFGAPLKILSGYLPPMTTNNFDIAQVVRTNAVNTAQEDCGKRKYSELHKLPHGLTGYFDYDQALACAKKLNKPILIDFTGYACVNCRKMEDKVWSDPRVLDLLRNEYIIASLYVDDKTTLPEEDWVVSDYDGKTKKTLGAKYADFQISRFGMNAQPAYIIVDYNDKVLIPEAFFYDPNVARFETFLKKGLEKFREKHGSK